MLGVWFDRITWCESTPVITQLANMCPPPDLEHVAKLLEMKPFGVITFGVQANEAVSWVGWKGRRLVAPHPSRRVIEMVSTLEKWDADYGADRGVGGSEVRG